MKKYLVIGGHVQSKNDRQMHYVDSGELCRLYNINPKECVLREDIDKTPITRFSNLIVLRPRFDGDYSLKDTK